LGWPISCSDSERAPETPREKFLYVFQGGPAGRSRRRRGGPPGTTAAAPMPGGPNAGRLARRTKTKGPPLRTAMPMCRPSTGKAGLGSYREQMLPNLALSGPGQNPSRAPSASASPQTLD